MSLVYLRSMPRNLTCNKRELREWLRATCGSQDMARGSQRLQKIVCLGSGRKECYGGAARSALVNVIN
jgi:hypothetical protein